MLKLYKGNAVLGQVDDGNGIGKKKKLKLFATHVHAIHTWKIAVNVKKTKKKPCGVLKSMEPIIIVYDS